jgi:hypothetical protein
MSDGEEARKPGYCIFGCGFHMVTPVPGRSGGVCGNCEQAGRLDLPPPPDRPRYSPRISMRQQRRVQRTAAEFWGYGDSEDEGSPFGEFFTSTRRWRYRLRWFLRREAIRWLHRPRRVSR